MTAPTAAPPIKRWPLSDGARPLSPSTGRTATSTRVCHTRGNNSACCWADLQVITLTTRRKGTSARGLPNDRQATTSMRPTKVRTGTHSRHPPAKRRMSGSGRLGTASSRRRSARSIVREPSRRDAMVSKSLIPVELQSSEFRFPPTFSLVTRDAMHTNTVNIYSILRELTESEKGRGVRSAADRAADSAAGAEWCDNKLARCR